MYLLSYIKRKMKEKKLRAVDVFHLSHNIVKMPMLAMIMQGVVPQKLQIVDSLAEALEEDKMKLRRLVVLDLHEQKINEFGLTPQQVSKEAKSHKLFWIPIFDVSNLKDCLSDTGYPEPMKAAGWLQVGLNYGEYAYAVQIPDDSMWPRVAPEEVAIFSQDYSFGERDFGLVAGRKDGVKQIELGEISNTRTFYIVEKVIHSKYYTTQFKPSELLFAHKAVAISLLPYSQRKSANTKRKNKSDSNG